MGALDGYRVLDLAVLVQGPQAAATLHDMGAAVLKIELPGLGDLGRVIPLGTDDPRSPYYEACNRGKRSVMLDLRTAGGKRAIERLVESADVLIHNFVPGTMERWGLSYDELSTINPRLVYATGSSFGPMGPRAGREGADMTGQAEGGLMFATRIAGGPPIINGAVIADHVGCQNMVAGILAALLHREKAGVGQRVDVSLVGGMVYAQASELTYTLLTGRNPDRVHSGHPIIPTLLHTVQAADGWIHLLSGTGPQWPDFAAVLGRDDLAGDQRFLDLVLGDQARAELVAVIDEVFPTRTIAEWETILAGAGVRYGVVRDYEAIAADPAMYENGYLQRVEHPDRGPCSVIGTPIRMSATPSPRASSPPSSANTPKRSSWSTASPGTTSKPSTRTAPSAEARRSAGDRSAAPRTSRTGAPPPERTSRTHSPWMRETSLMEASLGGTEVHDLWSDAVGDTFRVFAGHCGGEPQAILLVTDANGLFGMVVDTVRLMQIPALVPSLLVVGVGYPDATTLSDTVAIRARDLTPTPSRHFERSGHADDFIAFLSGELRPWLTDRWPAATDHLTYFGHSLGGLFGAYTLLAASSSFDRYIVSSPSLWWDDEVIFDIERERSDRTDLAAEVFFGIGSLETDLGRRLEATNLPTGHPAKPPPTHLDMVDDLRRFITRLAARNHPGLRISSVEVVDEFHATVPGVVLSRALRTFYPPEGSTDEADAR